MLEVAVIESRSRIAQQNYETKFDDGYLPARKLGGGIVDGWSPDSIIRMIIRMKFFNFF